jgi:hypothetical protein
VSICLLAARASIDILHSAFTHRHYIRSWWYNATHILYASTILLHVILLDKPHIILAANCEQTDLIDDVNKTLQILRSMDQMVVAGRYADLLGEILEVVGRSQSDHQRFQIEGRPTPDISSNVENGNAMERVGTEDRNLAHSTPTILPPQHSILSRDDVLANLMEHNPLNHFETPSDDLVFGASEGWNVAGNVFSDFTFTGESNDASLWDWGHN